MSENQLLAERFEANRSHLKAVAYRMLGSSSEAEDAVQESWLRSSRAGASGIDDLRAWLTTVVARVCLDMLRSRAARREEPSGVQVPEAARAPTDSTLEQEAILADSVGIALLVLLDSLAPAERLAFVLHDLFDLPFDEIAPLVGRSVEATRQLASRARRRVRGQPAAPELDVSRQRAVVEAFLAASRDGNFAALLAVLHPDVMLRADREAVPEGVPREARGAADVAKRAIRGRAGFAAPALVNGAVGVVVASRGRLLRVLGFTFAGEKIATIDVIADPARLRQLDLGVLGG